MTNDYHSTIDSQLKKPVLRLSTLSKISQFAKSYMALPGTELSTFNMN